MALEIERKFLVRYPQILEGRTGKKISQGYLTHPEDIERTVRVRIMQRGPEDREAFLTIKGPTVGMTRHEYEYSIPVSDAIEMMAMTPYTIEKTRYFIPGIDHVFEVDVFHGRYEGLIVAEVELLNETNPLPLPEWLGDEVTGDVKYYNSRMAGRDTLG